MHLRPCELASIQAILQKHVPDLEVWIFGSRVHGRCLKKFSDVDLAIIADEPIDFTRLCKLREAFAESDLPYRVDVVDYASVSPAFRDIIKREHEVIQKALKTGGTDSGSRAHSG